MVSYARYTHAGKEYIVTYTNPHGDIKIIGKHVKKLYADKSDEIQCKIPSKSDRERYEKIRNLFKDLSEDIADSIKETYRNITADETPYKQIGDGTYGLFVAKKLTLAEQAYADEAVIAHVQDTFENTRKYARDITNNPIKFHGFDRQFKPTPDDICKS